MDPFSDMGSTPISSTILQKAMRDLFKIAHGFFVRIFSHGWLVQAGGDLLRPKAHKKGLPGKTSPAALAAVFGVVRLLCYTAAPITW